MASGEIDAGWSSDDRALLWREDRRTSPIMRRRVGAAGRVGGAKEKQAPRKEDMCNRNKAVAGGEYFIIGLQ